MSQLEQRPRTVIKELVSVLPEKQKQLFTLAATFFWVKYNRQKQLQADFSSPEVKTPDSILDIKILFQEALKINEAHHGDRDGDSVAAYLRMLEEAGLDTVLFSQLSIEEMRTICYELDDMFENQAFCAFAEGWSMWEAISDTEFMLDTTPAILWLVSINDLKWFQRIGPFVDRRAIIEVVLEELKQKNTPALRKLLTGSDS